MSAIVIERTVSVPAAELAALRRDRERLRTADELWRMETGESLIDAVDQISEAMMAGLRDRGRPIRHSDGRVGKKAPGNEPGAPNSTRLNTVGGSITEDAADGNRA
jgi:hypothetical protein